jgi:hypothetical protein
MNGNSGVQSDPVSFNGTAQRGLFDQKSGPLSQIFARLRATDVPTKTSGFRYLSVALVPHQPRPVKPSCHTFQPEFHKKFESSALLEYTQRN